MYKNVLWLPSHGNSKLFGAMLGMSSAGSVWTCRDPRPCRLIVIRLWFYYHIHTILRRLDQFRTLLMPFTRYSWPKHQPILYDAYVETTKKKQTCVTFFTNHDLQTARFFPHPYSTALLNDDHTHMCIIYIVYINPSLCCDTHVRKIGVSSEIPFN